MPVYYSELSDDNNQVYLRTYLMRGGTYQFCWHKAVELMLVLKGEIEVYIEGELNNLQENDVLLINSNLGHSIFAKDVESITLIIEISPDYFNRCFFDYDALEINCFSDSVTRHNAVFSQIRFYMAKMISYSMTGNQVNKNSVNIYTAVLVNEIVQNFSVAKAGYSKNKKLNNDATALINAMTYIDQNFSNKISLEEAAKAAGYNRTYLSTLFKKKMGITFNEYVMRVRLKNAVDSLSDISAPVIKVALDNGFSDSKTFIQYIKKYCGKTPEGYRKELAGHPKMNRLYGDSRYVEYPSVEAEEKLTYFKQGFFYNASINERNADKEKVMEKVELYCSKIMETVEGMF